MPIDPGPHGRAVLEQEEQAQRGQRQPEHERGEPADAVDDALGERRDDLRDVRLHARRGVRGAALVDPDVLEPALRPRGGLGRVLRDRVVLRGDPADDEDQHDHRQRDQREQHDHGGRSPRHVPREPADDRHRHRRDDRRRHHRAPDRVGGPEEPDQAEDEPDQADEQPGGPPDTLEPGRRREGRAQLPELVHRDLRLLRSRSRVLPVPAREQAHCRGGAGPDRLRRRPTSVRIKLCGAARPRAPRARR